MKREILGYKCKKCGTMHYPNRTLCKKCGHDLFDSVPLARTGRLLTFTHLRTLAGDYTVPQIDLGIVELDDGMRITGQLNIKNPKIGMKVSGDVGIVRQSDYTTYYGMIFTAG